MVTMPSLLTVATSAMTSETGVALAENSSVFSLMNVGAGPSLSQLNVKLTSVAAISLLAVIVKTKLWLPIAGIVTGVLALPVGVLVTASVVW
jgi:hypothetical protein